MQFQLNQKCSVSIFNEANKNRNFRFGDTYAWNCNEFVLYVQLGRHCIIKSQLFNWHWHSERYAIHIFGQNQIQQIEHLSFPLSIELFKFQFFEYNLLNRMYFCTVLQSYKGVNFVAFWYKMLNWRKHYFHLCVKKRKKFIRFAINSDNVEHFFSVEFERFLIFFQSIITRNCIDVQTAKGVMPREKCYKM